jgi:uncharacterized protein
VTASCVYEGAIRHRRHDPVRHELRYPIALLFLDLGELPEALDASRLWSARRRAPGRFRRADYLGDPARPLDEEVRRVVLERTGARPSGPIRVLTHARTFGHCFNPVSFYYCYDPAGRRVETVVAEVTNTPWGERHAYVLRRDGDGPVLEERLDKAFHVSPFMGMDHRYHWRVVEPGEQLVVHIDAVRAGRRAFDATLTLRRRELDRRTLRRLLLRYPAATLVAGARIYAHALRLRLKGAPCFPHPGRAAR